MNKVAKFGGTSLADDNQFKKVYNIIKNDDTIKYVVASAPGSSKIKGFNDKVTDLLYKCYKYKSCNNDEYKNIFSVISERFKTIAKNLSLQINIQNEIDNISLEFENNCSEDYFVSRGEYLNSLLLSEYLGYQFVDAKDIIIFNDNGVLDADKTNKEISKVLKDIKYAVIPGFYGLSKSGKIKTFSRGGSDITGSLIAKAVSADIYENWTDVSGMLMADPRVIDNPKKIDIITYKELRELAYMGATVLHDEAVFPVRDSKICINIRNTNNPTNCGTLIVDHIDDDTEIDRIITGISGKKNYTVFNISKANMANQVGFVRMALDVFYKRKIAVEHIPTGIDCFSVIVSSKNVENQAEMITNELRKNCKADSVNVYSDIALISSVGRNIRNKSSIYRRLFNALEKENIDIKIIGQGVGDINIILGVDNVEFENTIQAIYEEFI